MAGGGVVNGELRARQAGLMGRLSDQYGHASGAGSGTLTGVDEEEVGGELPFKIRYQTDI